MGRVSSMSPATAQKESWQETDCSAEGSQARTASSAAASELGASASRRSAMARKMAEAMMPERTAGTSEPVTQT
jgi:hypothetical protein